jgi:hypothetical protein
MPFSNIGFDMSDVPRPAWRFTSFPLSTRYVNPPMEWALVNASRNEALPLETKGVMTGTLLPIPVYPGSRSSRELEIRGSSRSQPNFVPDSSWLAGAELHMVEWVEIGSYRLRIATDSGALIVR